MAYRGSVVRGTPYHHVGTKGTAHEGMEHGAKSRGMDGTSPSQYGSEKGGYRDEHVKGHGTPFHSKDGNGPEYKRTVSHDKHGIVKSEKGMDHNDPRDNGVGVILDGANSYERGYGPHKEPTMDSPVPRHAPVFDRSFIAKEDAAHAGSGNEHTATGDLLSIDGVMSRGMVGTSSRHGPETELMEDDQFGMEGHATQSQPRGSVKHEKE